MQLDRRPAERADGIRAAFLDIGHPVVLGAKGPDTFDIPGRGG